MPFPTDLDNLQDNYLGTDQVDVVDHAGMHNSANAAINELQAKVGIDDSEDENSLDYLLKQAESPGHTHEVADITDFPTNSMITVQLDGVTLSTAVHTLNFTGGAVVTVTDGIATIIGGGPAGPSGTGLTTETGDYLMTEAGEYLII